MQRTPPSSVDSGRNGTAHQQLQLQQQLLQPLQQKLPQQDGAQQQLPQQQQQPIQIPSPDIQWSSHSDTAHANTGNSVSSISLVDTPSKYIEIPVGLTPIPDSSETNSGFSEIANRITKVATRSIITGQKSKMPTVQTGINIYFAKRVLSSPTNGNRHSAKIQKTNPVKPSLELGQNRYAILAEENDSDPKPKSQKPPPIYLRERNSNSLIKDITQNIGPNNFHVISILRGQVHETKIQIYSESNYRKIVNLFDKLKKSYYTYQLKSSKGLSVVLKGIEPFVECDEIKTALSDEGFQIKSVFNIQNQKKIPQPLFRVELEFDSKLLKKGEPHPIYSLRYLLHRKITIEVPHKRSGPIQCHNCQEYGHTKSYCTLPSVCVICGDLHETGSCTKTKEDSTIKKCSNCGGNHTANYRGCAVYQSFIKKTENVTQKHETWKTQKFPPLSAAQSFANPLTKQGVSYASALKSGHSATVHAQPAPPSSSLEQTLQIFMQNMSQFMSGMQNMMQEMIKNQSLLLQHLMSKP